MQLRRRRTGCHAPSSHASMRRGTVACAKPKKGPSNEVKEQQQEDVDKFEEDGWMDDNEDEEWEDGGGDDDLALLGIEDDEAPGVSTAGVDWAEAGLKAAEKVLATPAMQGIEIYTFRPVVQSKKLVIRLDKLSDRYGSPSIDDIEKFSRMMFLEMDALLGEEAAGDVSFEVSSPGAERELLLPKDLDRFQEMPLRVEYVAEDGADVTKVMELLEYDEAQANTLWRLADVKANSPGKGRAMSKKQRELRVTIPAAKIVRARIHVDF